MALLHLADTQAKGTVYLVGAGPGDPELLTLKAWRLLKNADVVLYDALVSEQILSLIPASAEKIAVGKRAGSHSASQQQINRLLVTKAYSRACVVRLKGGDPFIFGRGGEELQALAAAGIAFEVVPGITAASGAAAYAGFPLTHRDMARSVTFITGHGQNAGAPIDWQQYRQADMTLVVYMGILNAAIIQDGLLAAGRAADTPVALVSCASTPQQQCFHGTLSELGSLVNEPQLKMPALIVIGQVTALASQLNWFEAAQITPPSAVAQR
ncbi:uroporphyrinogen-III C-methyltransferase [Shewanella dokdonensis]|uniref:uroporphyrinogen-III C-methyltransferase n=1 Tax=Shewanella dokdonensis TaxID=712036 RepID=A0ABX8DH61_9GAMM|nr:uroporphyrinogen-III C-methyltransferase [Shewanella dokdonensis]MCL1074341.1 uroporphyrinogen-III C-methyltransferase [Shewanella dokdonensis]QVK24028.1 uroporphyrinogen-III C-methyltransferase [Shewanella dokdonensis]